MEAGGAEGSGGQGSDRHPLTSGHEHSPGSQPGSQLLPVTTDVKHVKPRGCTGHTFDVLSVRRGSSTEKPSIWQVSARAQASLLSGGHAQQPRPAAPVAQGTIPPQSAPDVGVKQGTRCSYTRGPHQGPPQPSSGDPRLLSAPGVWLAVSLACGHSSRRRAEVPACPPPCHPAWAEGQAGVSPHLVWRSSTEGLVCGQGVVCPHLAEVPAWGCAEPIPGLYPG